MQHRSETRFRPPAPVPLPSRPGLIELLIRLRRNPLECWSADLFEQPIAKVDLPFTQAFLVHDPQAIKRVLMDHSANYRKDAIQRRILSSGLSEGLLSVEGNRWEVQRRMLASTFSRRTVTSFTASMLAAANELAAKWKEMGDGATVDVAAEMALVTLNVLALTIFSDGIGSDIEDFRTAMNSYFGVIGRIGALDLFGVPKFVPRPGHRRLLRTMSYFESVIDTIINVRRKKIAADAENIPNDLLTFLLCSLDPSTGRQLDPREVRSNILTFLSAGHETTANTLSWSIFLLSQSPEWRSRVAEEAERELASPVDGLADRLTVTKAVIEEALRLYPPIAALSREAIEADTLANMAVKPRSLIVISPYVLHRHRRLWSEPDAFDPTRFLPDARGRIPRFAYLPFGIGPRTCIGSSFALQEATIVLAVLTRNFDLRLSPQADVWPLQRITLRPANGLPMQIGKAAPLQRPSNQERSRFRGPELMLR
jgi:cytochrome P450